MAQYAYNPITGNLDRVGAGSSSIAIETVNGDFGSISGSSVTIYSGNSGNNAGSTVSFNGIGNALLFNVTDSIANTFIGKSAGNLAVSGIANSGFGQASLNAITSGLQNSAFGSGSLLACTSGSFNTAGGYFSLAGLTTASSNTAYGWGALGNVNGNNNTAHGFQALQNLLTGTGNLALGLGAGILFSGSESGNIVIDNSGIAGESNVTRIGTSQTKFYAAGISGASVSNSKQVYIDTVTGQLGATALDNQSDTIAIRSTLIDMTQLGTTVLFTPEADFVVTGFTAFAQTITGTAGSPVANFGWTNPLYNDTLTGYTTFSAIQGNYNNLALSGSNVPFVPAGVPFQINITTADVVATANVQRIDILGYYLN